ncbi:MAG: hypothetical protein MI724_06265 [Spirochaetales bacterium]|nr:hypothetical protein [Spirochaetales bacterium]
MRKYGGEEGDDKRDDEDVTANPAHDMPAGDGKHVSHRSTVGPGYAGHHRPMTTRSEVR